LITEERIRTLAEEHLRGTPLFLTAVKVAPSNQIHVSLDGDNGVTIDDCVALSRHIEGALDREKEDFALDVSSHGASAPLLFPRQFRRHIGRELDVKLGDGTRAAGKLVSADDNGFTLEYEVRENKPVGKGKITVTKTRAIAYSEAREARIILKF
jgi:ribosome maturation factor RimP